MATADAEFDRLRGGGPGEPGADRRRWDRLARPYPASYARWRAAELLIAVPRPTFARGACIRRTPTPRCWAATVLAEEIIALARRARVDLAAHTAPVAESAPENPFRLTDRELQVLGLLMTGQRNREIAKALYMSVSTASVHVSNILNKLGAKNRMEAAAIAHRLHIGDAAVNE